ncbi:MAG: hypothetical protein JWM25_297 [Thermoleophilia bacterium]|nr:hypothetical protein [Thermoleophilia bacterium]MCZ4495714.1 hypothetical protein [Thermoleophilia bacterium]
MDSSIGSALASFADLSVQNTMRMAGVESSDAIGGTQSFGAQLEASFRARAEQLGVQLPEATSQASVGAGVETSADAWKRAQIQSLADGNGPGDAMLKTLADASRDRHDKRHSGASGFFG